MTKSNPRVSIGMPVYHGEPFLEEAINSILAQTFEDFELIISDNASTDETENICKEYAAKDRRILYYRNKENIGAAKNYNRVFNLSKGKYFKWAAHDDVCAPTFLERCVEALEKNARIVLSYPKTIIIDSHGNHVKQYFDNLHLSSVKPSERFRHFHRSLRTISERNSIFGVIRANVLKKTPLIGGYVSSDTLLLAELALRGMFYEVPEPLFFRRDHSQTSVRANPDYYKRSAWFNADKKWKLVLPRWRWLREYYHAILRVDLNLKERCNCFTELGKWMIRNKIGMVEDIIECLKQGLLNLKSSLIFN
jgi:glycosyltransferase involved in cell wall biosynthesis